MSQPPRTVGTVRPARAAARSGRLPTSLLALLALLALLPPGGAAQEVAVVTSALDDGVRG